MVIITSSTYWLLFPIAWVRSSLNDLNLWWRSSLVFVIPVFYLSHSWNNPIKIHGHQSFKSPPDIEHNNFFLRIKIFWFKFVYLLLETWMCSINNYSNCIYDHYLLLTLCSSKMMRLLIYGLAFLSRISLLLPDISVVRV